MAAILTYVHTEDCPACLTGRVSVSFDHRDGKPILPSMQMYATCQCGAQLDSESRGFLVSLAAAHFLQDYGRTD